jgi:hypothetical protein
MATRKRKGVECGNILGAWVRGWRLPTNSLTRRNSMPDLSKTKKQWIFSEYYGFPKAPEAADCIYYGKSLLCIANADGTLADEERRWIMGFSYTNGVSWDEVSGYLFTSLMCL